MPKIRYERINTGSVADGGSVTKDWICERDYHLDRLWIIERGTGDVTNVQVDIDIVDEPITRPDCPATLFDPINAQPALIDWPMPKGTKITIKITNNSGASQNYDIVLVLKYD